MQDPLQFYQSEKQLFEKELATLKRKLVRSSTFRLLVFTGTVLGIYFFFGQLEIVIPIALTGIVLFLFLLIKHNHLQLLKNLKKALILINKREIDVLNGDYLSLEQGNEYIDADHYYSFDIDLFGRGSFFQYSNRTATKAGEKKLASLLSQNDIFNIKDKQNAIIELSKIPKWRHHFTAIANLVKTTYPENAILQWICNYTSVFPKFLSFVPVVFSIISLALTILFGFQIISSQILLIWFFIGLGFSGFYLKKVNILYNNASKAKDTFKQYHQLLDEIERIELDSTLLKEKQNDILFQSLKSSFVLNQFSKIINALDQRNNDIAAIILNGFFLWDLRQVYKIEKWINLYHDKVENWFKVIAFFDAQNSLANFAFNHPEFSFPEIGKGNSTIVATNLGHPLIKEPERIDNDFYIKNQQFYIITGANMAGKSTFLRTVSLSIIMANMGLPVCADSYKYTPIKLITSMRTSDSLTDDESYFFSELKRLKFIVDKIEQDEYYIVLDEILKGTNSKDKAIGSKKFIEKLVNSGSTGMVATHDLSLCEIEKEHKQIDNYYFDAEIISDELYFDFKLKNGICKNMNASFLLKKMKII